MKTVAKSALGVLIGLSLLVTGCAVVGAKNNIPNLGLFEMKSWQSFDDPNYGGGNMQVLLLHDKETNKDYILTETAHGSIAITERK